MKDFRGGEKFEREGSGQGVSCSREKKGPREKGVNFLPRKKLGVGVAFGKKKKKALKGKTKGNVKEQLSKEQGAQVPIPKGATLVGKCQNRPGTTEREKEIRVHQEGKELK